MDILELKFIHRNRLVPVELSADAIDPTILHGLESLKGFFRTHFQSFNIYIKRQFWEELDMVIQDVPRSEKLFIGGDFNGWCRCRRV